VKQKAKSNSCRCVSGNRFSAGAPPFSSATIGVRRLGVCNNKLIALGGAANLHTRALLMHIPLEYMEIYQRRSLVECVISVSASFALWLFSLSYSLGHHLRSPPFYFYENIFSLAKCAHLFCLLKARARIYGVEQITRAACSHNNS